MNLAIKRIIHALLISIAVLLTVVVIISFPRLGWKVWEPNWSPAGDLIAFRCVFISPEKLDYDSFYLYDWSDICLTDQNGKKLRVLTSGGNVSNFSWSPDGRKLAWAHERDLAWESISIWNSQ